jgi:hypothetical protein
MQEEQPITLADIRREAEALEFNVDISSGYLDIYRRSDSSTGHYSLQPIDDPRTLLFAWAFLQQQRAFLDQVDAARTDIANRPPRRSRPDLANLYRSLGFALAIAIGAIIAQRTNNVLLALLVFVGLFAVVALVPVRRRQ